MTEKKPTIAGLQAQIDELLANLGERQKRLEEARQGVDHVTRRNNELEKLVAHKDQENDRLRDELHDHTVTIARLEGYRDRVLEFDPVTERQVYLDEGGELTMDEHRGAPPSFVTRRRRQRHDFADNVGASIAAMKGTDAPWYRRRG